MNIRKNKAFILIESLVALWLLISCLFMFMRCFNIFLEQKKQLETRIKIEEYLLNKMKDSKVEQVKINGQVVKVHYDEKQKHVWLDYKGKRYEHQVEK